MAAAGVAAAIAAGILIFILTRHSNTPSKPKAVAVKGCSLLSATDAAKFLGEGTYLQQAKTSKVENVIIVGCQYNKAHSSNSIIIGQKTPTTNYSGQVLNRSFFSNISSGEAQIVFANYTGFIDKNHTGNIRLWFKNTWLQVFSPTQKVSEEVLTGFVKSH